MKALMTRFLRAPAVYQHISVPAPEASELQIKVAYVALNPTDHKHASTVLPPSKIVGCEFSGKVTALGAQAAAAGSFAVGDRVAGVVHGCKSSRTGAFAEVVVADAGLCFKVPDTADLEAACTLGVGWISAAQALRQRLYNDEKKTKEKKEEGGGSSGGDDTLLIYSAATSTGMHAIQQARIDFPSTYIIAIASSQHHERLRELGAHATFDYKSSSLVSDIQSLGRDIRKALDCHSEGESTVLTAKCMIPRKEEEGNRAAADGDSKNAEPRRIIRTLPPVLIRGTLPPGVRADEWILAYTALGKPFWFLFKYYPSAPADYKTATTYIQNLTNLLRDGRVKPVKHRLMPGGLESITKGFEELRSGRVRGEKLVYKID